MCHKLDRRHFGLLLGAALSQPAISFASDVKAIRALHGRLDIDQFKSLKTTSGKALRLASSAKQTVFVIGQDAFLTDDAFEAEVTLDEAGALQGLRLLAGQTLAAIQPKQGRVSQLILPNATGSIRGTGFYANVSMPDAQDYVCCCYGHIAFDKAADGTDQALKNTYHNATSINGDGQFVTPQYGFPYGHYDDELVLLEQAVGRRPHWQLPDGKMHFLAPYDLPALG